MFVVILLFPQVKFSRVYYLEALLLHNQFIGANILDEYLRSHSDQFSNQVINRENAIKVLDMWMQQNVIRPLQSLPTDSPQFYMDSKKVFYIMNRDEDHKLFIIILKLKRSDSAKGGEKTSITRLDSNASNHFRSRSSTFGIFSFGGPDSEALKGMYKSVSFLSTILAKMGIGDSEVHLWKDDEMDDLLQSSLFLRYLWLMIPEALRVHLGNVLHFLEWTIGTEQFISLRSPYFLGKRGSGGIENFELVLNKLRIFIVPQTITKVNQNSLIEILISLRKSGKLGEMPSELQSDMNSKRTADQENVVPLRFCLDAVDGFDTDTELSHVLTAIIDDPQLSYQDKMIKCQQFRQHHPKLEKVRSFNCLIFAIG
uniref:Peptidase_M13_N domain-containing protein n=1 Tax=Heterorhabditis bacteriophora TaxID=37862 RepID=A0A1I7WBW0_HETBA